MEQEPTYRPVCVTCFQLMTVTERWERSPVRQWECPDGHTVPIYTSADEGEA